MLAGITWRIGAIIAAALAALLFVGFATQTIRIEGLNVWPVKIVGFKQENRALVLDLELIKKMQETARLKAEVAKAEAEREYREKAERTDNEYEKRLARANARADDYARRMRAEAARRTSSGAGGASDSGNAQGSDGPGEGAGMVAVTRDDFDIFVENTTRLQCAHAWAVSVERGEAVADCSD